MTDPNTLYTVSLWASHPDEGNDDCNTGSDFASVEEARIAFLDVEGELLVSTDDWAFVELDGPDVHEVRENPNYDERKAARRREHDEREWQRERAMQAGMAFGCDGYNDEMGY